jgi:hypothetical protein
MQIATETNDQRTSAQIEALIRAPNLASDRPAHPRTLRATENIIQACNSLELLKRPITASAAGILTEKMEGGPTRGGLRNSKNFTAYVKARASEQRLTHAEKLSGPVVAKTGNPQFDADMAALLAQNQMLAGRIKCYAKLLKSLGHYDIEAAINRGELVLSERTPNSEVSQDVRDAVAALTDPQNLQRNGLEMTVAYQIVSPRLNGILLNKAQVESLRQLVMTPTQPKLGDGRTPSS